MPTIKEMQEQRASLVAEARTLTEAARDETRSLSDDEKSKVDGLLDEAEKLGDKIKAAEDEETRCSRLEQAEKDLYFLQMKGGNHENFKKSIFKDHGRVGDNHGRR